MFVMWFLLCKNLSLERSILKGGKIEKEGEGDDTICCGYFFNSCYECTCDEI